MTQLTGPTAFYDVMTTLVSALVADLATTGGGPVERYGIVPGDIAWDDCCGMLAMSLTRQFPSETFPQTASVVPRVTPCELPWLVGVVTMQVVRCAPTMDETGNPPTVDALDEAARLLVADMWVLHDTTRRTLCGMVEDDLIIDFLVGDVAAVGPGSGASCVAAELQSQVSTRYL